LQEPDRRIILHRPEQSLPPRLTTEKLVMKSIRIPTFAIVTALVSVLRAGALSAQDKYNVKVPGGLAFTDYGAR
jgi:hypothetical protein